MRRGGSAGVGVGGGGGGDPWFSVVLRGFLWYSVVSRRKMNSRVGDLFPSNFDVFFRCVFFEASNHIFCKQCEKVTPKGTQKDNPNHQIHGCTTSQNIWYLQYGSHILQFWMCFGIHFFSHRSSDTVFSSLFSLFEKLGARIVPKMDEYSMQKI